MNDCLFCKIIEGKILSPNKIYEDTKVIALLDIEPISRGHTIVIPKKHSENILDTDDNLLKHTVIVVKKLANKIKNVVEADGINIHINNHLDAGQVVFHPHMHIIPRFREDGLKLWCGKKYKDIEMGELREKIKKQL